MEQVRVPNTELRVSNLCLGTANFGAGVSEEDCHAILDCYYGQGGNFLDTARIYSNWVPGERSRSERIIGDWLQNSHRSGVVVATKGGHPQLHGSGQLWLDVDAVRADLEGSLSSLRLETIDLYYLHRDDPTYPAAQIMDTLHQLCQEGMIRYYGCSNWSTARIQEAQTYCQAKGYTGFVANQMLWNVGSYQMKPLKDPTMEVLDTAMHQYHQQTGLLAAPFSSQANGFFTKWARASDKEREALQDSQYCTPANLALFEQLAQVAEENGMSITETVVSYLSSQPFAVVPIIGCRNIDQLRETLAGADKRLPVDVVRKINEAAGVI